MITGCPGMPSLPRFCRAVRVVVFFAEIDDQELFPRFHEVFQASIALQVFYLI